MSLRFLIGFVAAGLSLGADISGAWKASYKMPDGYRHESTITLKVQDGKLTGEIQSKRGKVPITEGSVSGNDVTFYVVRTGNGDELKIEFRGTVDRGTMKLRMQYRDHDPVEITAKREQS